MDVIVPDGNVGIGTTSPDNKLHVEGTATNALIQLDQLGTGVIANFKQGGSSKVLIDNGGNVGIGTDSPGANLDVAGTAPVIRITNTTDPLGNGTVGSFEFFTNDSSTGATRTVSSIVCDNQAGSSVPGGELVFKTSLGGSGSPVATEKMRITSGGNVLFGTQGTPNGTSVYGSGFIKGSNSRSTLNMATSSTILQAHLWFYNPNGAVGYIATTGSQTNYTTTSDYRLKEDLKEFNGLEMVSNISVYDYKWKADESRSYGVMAHELQEVLPDAVVGEKDAEEMQGVDYSKIVPLLIKSIQELTAKVERLEEKNTINRK